MQQTRHDSGWRGMTIADQLARHARTTPDDAAYRFAGTGRSYAEVDERVTRLAAVLTGWGVRHGDRVAVLALNGLEVVECFLAAARIGAVAVPVNFRLAPAEVAYVLADSGARVLVVDPATAATAQQAGPPEHVLTVGPDYEAALAAADPTPVEHEVGDTDAAFLMYTSGTTGRPKGAVLTHRNLLMHAFSHVTHLGWAPDDRVTLYGAPLFHIAAVAGMLPNLLLGGTFVITRSGSFDPAETLDEIVAERVSSCFFVPAAWQAVVDVPDLAERDLSRLRRISWGAAPASTTLLQRMLDLFPQAELVTAFGQTECSPVTCFLRGPDAVRKIGSVGTPMLNVEVRVVDEAMRDVPRGEVGEIVYRSPMVMREYWGKPAETAAAFEGGWFHSGDLVRQDDEGYFYVVDRKKDIIISGGENIYCAEVEDVLAAHPGVAEVALIGVPDDRWGEAPLAVLAARDPAAPPTAAELTAWCRERMAHYKCPREFHVVGALPRNPSGKVLKTELRKDHGA
ncbi:long-chain-fatty-acid--CoA ligase [Klenkia brasiliensis]|uniref:Fatty-acyl-CoA synthase n=1 Tax=Klenkia brasiliensis TaxID=333142 RepID=A0A1G7YLI1_9ACTN|nr:long-chain-fatty-acid--CoA ligase [Klenkia brasiliensis]SDG97361.1 fatty-acyl-CoA synthase [Klenkia brasiliensis]